MFKSIIQTSYSFQLETYKIIDDDFEEEIKASDFLNIRYSKSPNPFEIIIVEETQKVIIVYEKRKLNVAMNLCLLFKYMNKVHYDEISKVVELNITNNKLYLPYKEEVEKYLLLM